MLYALFSSFPGLEIARLYIARVYKGKQKLKIQHILETQVTLSVKVTV